jgi:choline dehydrogenase-like flavoprotein
MADSFDFVIIGSGFGGSVSAMRLTEKGYSVLVFEKGKRFEDKDFAKSNWQFWKYLWLPILRAHGILQISILKGVMVLHGAGVGGGSLGYANVLEVPTDETFATPAWTQNVRWGEVLRPYYEVAKNMLGASRNPRLWKAIRSSGKWRTTAAWGTPSARRMSARTLARRELRSLTRISAGKVPHAPAASTVADAWSGAGTTPKIHFRKTIYISQKRTERKSKLRWR